MTAAVAGIDWHSVGDWAMDVAHFLVASICANVVGNELAKKLHFPLISGYLLAGLLVGPNVLDVIKRASLPQLAFINEFSLAAIAFSAGVELYFPSIRSHKRAILVQTAWISTITFVLCTVVIASLSSVLDFLEDHSVSCRIGIAAVAGAVMVGRSPSSALALIDELDTRGPITKTLLGVTVVSDVVLLVGFAITQNVAMSFCLGAGLGWLDFGLLLLTLVVCGVAGLLLGELLILYLWIPGIRSQVRGMLILSTGWAWFHFSNWFADYSDRRWEHRVQIEPLLVCMIAGCLAGNESKNRRKFANILHKSAPYVFLPFFTMTGAQLEFSSLGLSAFTAFMLFIVRLGGIASGSFIGGKYFTPGMSKLHYTHLWASLTTQAGGALGLANEIQRAYPTMGGPFAAAIVLVVCANQLVGPYLFRWSLQGVHEDAEGRRLVKEKQFPEQDILDQNVDDNGRSIQDGWEHVSDDAGNENDGASRAASNRVSIIGLNMLSLSTARRLVAVGRDVVIVPESGSAAVCESGAVGNAGGNAVAISARTGNHIRNAESQVANTSASMYCNVCFSKEPLDALPASCPGVRAVVSACSPHITLSPAARRTDGSDGQGRLHSMQGNTIGQDGEATISPLYAVLGADAGRLVSESRTLISMTVDLDSQYDCCDAFINHHVHRAVMESETQQELGVSVDAARAAVANLRVVAHMHLPHIADADRLKKLGVFVVSSRSVTAETMCQMCVTPLDQPLTLLSVASEVHAILQLDRLSANERMEDVGAGIVDALHADKSDGHLDDDLAKQEPPEHWGQSNDANVQTSGGIEEKHLGGSGGTARHPPPIIVPVTKPRNVLVRRNSPASAYKPVAGSSSSGMSPEMSRHTPIGGRGLAGGSFPLASSLPTPGAHPVLARRVVGADKESQYGQRIPTTPGSPLMHRQNSAHAVYGLLPMTPQPSLYSSAAGVLASSVSTPPGTPVAARRRRQQALPINDELDESNIADGRDIGYNVFGWPSFNPRKKSGVLTGHVGQLQGVLTSRLGGGDNEDREARLHAYSHRRSRSRRGARRARAPPSKSLIVGDGNPPFSLQHPLIGGDFRSSVPLPRRSHSGPRRGRKTLWDTREGFESNDIVKIGKSRQNKKMKNTKSEARAAGSSDTASSSPREYRRLD